MAELGAARERVAAAARHLAAERLVRGTAGNVSERTCELVAVTPTGAPLEHLTAKEVVIVDLADAQVEGELAPTSELQLHLGIYRRFASGAEQQAAFGEAVAKLGYGTVRYRPPGEQR